LKAPLKGRKVRLQGGYLYTKPGLGAAVMYGKVLRRWSTVEGGPRGHLGYPTRNVREITGGLRGDFQHGTIVWHRSTNTYTVTEN
jgi:uncharacterized protein with LGFP repeats